MDSNTIIISKGMERVCADFSQQIAAYGFTQTKKCLWLRQHGKYAETIYFHRNGSSYGKPRTPSVDLRIMLGLSAPDDASIGPVSLISDHTRRPNGYAYHHRFNAQTWSTYERCLEELLLFVDEIAVPWFRKQVSSLPV
ncbi:hypothetical protein [Novosphingobium sp. KA1]|uniref:hypothetical protein n=1 Tax=Novosphingobium sp. (strain KA1) TaxID=164608 RepID=UPI001A8E450D|nr:hypothetical protein [Novosphingobium sp. KA1]